jgi:hypothetical protein
MEHVRVPTTLPRLYKLRRRNALFAKLPFVTVLTPVRAAGDKGPGWQVSPSCSRCQEYGSCPKKQEPAVRRSRVHPTEFAYLQELLKRLQDQICKKEKMVWCDDPTEDRVISIFAGCLPNHDRVHSQNKL